MILLFILTLVMHLTTSMHIPEDVEFLDGYSPEQLYQSYPEDDTYLEARGLVSNFPGIRNKRSQKYDILESPGLKSHFNIQRRRLRSAEQEVSTEYESSENISITSPIPSEELPTAEKQIMDHDLMREGRVMDKWKSPFTGDYSKVQDVDDSLTGQSAINEGIQARAPRVNFITQQRRAETAETREAAPVIAKPTDGYRRSSYDDGYSPRINDNYYPVRNYEDYPRNYERYDRGIYDTYYPTNDRYDYRRSRYDPYEAPYIPRSVDHYYNQYPNNQYDIAEPRDYRPLYTNDIAERLPPINRNRRIIYYANLPEVVRTPPNVDLRYRSYRYDRYDPLYGYFPSPTEAYRSHRSPKDFVRPSPTPKTISTDNRNVRDDNDKFNSNPVRITSSLKVQEVRPNENNRVYSQSRDGRNSDVSQTNYQHQDFEDRDSTYFSRRH